MLNICKLAELDFEIARHTSVALDYLFRIVKLEERDPCSPWIGTWQDRLFCELFELYVLKQERETAVALCTSQELIFYGGLK